MKSENTIENKKTYEDLTTLVSTNFCITHFIIDGDDLWFTSGSFNYLFRMSTSDWVVKDAIRIPLDKAYVKNNCIKYIFENDEYIYMIPFRVKDILIRYNLRDGIMEKLDINLPQGMWGDCTDEDNQFVYMTKKDEPKLIRINKTTLEVDEKIIETGKGYTFVKKMDMNYVLIRADNGTIVVWNETDGVKQVITNNVEGLGMKYGHYYSDIGEVLPSGTIILFPRYSNKFCMLDIKNKRITAVKDVTNKKDGPMYSCVRMYEDKIYAFHNHDNDWKIYDMNGNCIMKRGISFSKEVLDLLDKANIIKDYSNIYSPLMEDDSRYTLKRFMNSI